MIFVNSTDIHLRNHFILFFQWGFGCHNIGLTLLHNYSLFYLCLAVWYETEDRAAPREGHKVP